MDVDSTKEEQMKIMVGYNGSAASHNALALACDQAADKDGLIFIITSMGGGSSETTGKILEAREILQAAESYAFKRMVQCETVQLARGLSPGEDLVKFAEDNGIDQIYLGIEKISRTKKILLGSTAQYVILKGPCPVTTTR
jgi:nucleotide-binding universal stress UspA family protein